MKFKDLVAEVAYESQVSQKTVAKVLKTLASVLPQAINTDGAVNLPGIGKFDLRFRQGRTARNPRTGESVEVAARNVVAFKPAKALSDNVA